MGHRARYMIDAMKRLKSLGVENIGSISRVKMEKELSSAMVLMHELVEWATDPFFGGMAASTGLEMGDLCGGTPHKCPIDPTSLFYFNVNLSGSLFVLTDLWNNYANSCSFGSYLPCC
jgi:hypothetical protein